LKKPGAGVKGAMVMKLFVGWAISAAVMVTATAAGAQALSNQGLSNQSLPPLRAGVSTVSDFGGPYAAMPPDAMPPGTVAPLLPPQEVFSILRERGFAPLGVLRLHGFIYSVAVINPDGDDGRLVIDARNGRIIRFMPALQMGDRMGDEGVMSYGPEAPLPPGASFRGGFRGVPRPPAPVPNVASRSPTGVPLPKPMPRAVAEPKPPTPLAATPAAAAPVRQSSIGQAKASESQAAAPAPVEAKPGVQILPTQEMPKVQGLD
jgi:hypothetical protein